MIFTSPGRARSVRAVAATVTALSAVLGSVLAAAPASAAVDEEPAPAVSFTVAPTDHGIVRGDRTVSVSLTIANPTGETLPDGDVTIEIGSEPLASAADVTTWRSSGRTAAALDTVARTSVDDVAAQTEDSDLFVLPSGALRGHDAGVYPLRAVYDGGAAEPLVSVSTLTVVAEDEDAAGVAVVVPITASPLTAGLLTADELDEATADGGVLAEQLDAVDGTTAILAVDPAVVAAIRVLGTSAPESAAAWLARLLELPNERFALQFGDADLATQFAAGLDAPLTPPTLSPYLDPDDFIPVEGTPTPTASPEAVDPEPVLPALGELTDIGPAQAGIHWPAAGTAGADTVAAIGALGPSAVTLLPSDALEGAYRPRADVGGAAVLAYDASVSELLHAASTAETDAEREAALTDAVAIASFVDAGAPLLLTVDRAVARSGDALRTTIATATSLPERGTVRLADLLALTPADADVRAVDADEERVAALTDLRAPEADLVRMATLLDDPADMLASDIATTLQLIGNGWLETPDAWRAAVDARLETTAGWTDGVGIVPSPALTLAASNASLIFTVRNDLPWPVTTELITTPNDARLVVRGRTTVEVGAQQTLRVEVPVEARVGSGESSVDLRLVSRTGVAIGPVERVSVAVRADWESVAIVVMSVLVTGLIVLGAIRTVRRRRTRATTEEVALDGRAG